MRIVEKITDHASDEAFDVGSQQISGVVVARIIEIGLPLYNGRMKDVIQNKARVDIERRHDAYRPSD